MTHHLFFRRRKRCFCAGFFSLILFLTLNCLAGGTYPRIEAAFNLPGVGTDPFDYTITDVKVSILQPDSTTIVLPAFFDGGTTWRVRHTPVIPGTYLVTSITLGGSPVSYSNLQPSSWNVSGMPNSEGFVRIDPLNATRFITSNGRRYYPMGEDVAWDNGAATVTAVFGKMGPTRQNWARVWMNHWDGKNLDWLSNGTSPGPLGQLSLTVAQKWDSIVLAAEQSGIHFQLVLQHHGQYSTTVDPNWSTNPYNVSNAVSSIGFLTNATQFFTNATAKALTKRKMRYAIARWGYSPSIMAWELFNEVQFTDAAQNGMWSIVGAWHDEMAQFIRSQDPYQHLITTSSDVNQPIWNQVDYYQHHDYPADYITGLRDAQGLPIGQPVRPIFSGEAGRDNTVYYGQHAPLWAGLISGQSGAAQPWYWDTMDSQRCYNLVRPVRDFILSAGIAEQNTLNKSTPAVTGGPLSPLTFALGGGWATAVQDTFTVGNGAPDGAGAAPNFLQGNFHRAMTPNGYTFLVNYSQAGIFSVEIDVIAASGAGFQMFRDNVLQTNVSFAAAGSDVSTNLVFTIPVSAGAHSIKLWNPGSDWVQLGNITLDPYATLLGGYQIGNTNFAAVWLWHRTNIYRTTATSTISGSLPLSGLKPGTYSGTWWDTFSGSALSNFNFSVVDTNPVVLATPPVLRSIAFFAGKAPQATVTAPTLTYTMGTNSPALTVPLVITNSGGLPLFYSLSITGASPVTYTARNSAQPGGPVVAWKDISGVGQDITASFTALAAPKVARDEGIAGPFNIGFGFPFFSGAQSPSIFTQLYVSPNGYIAFSPFAGDTSVNTVLPSTSAPSNSIAFFWDDLVATNSTGRIYLDSDPLAGTCTIQFQTVRFKSNSLTITCQLILKSTGEILMQYQSIAFSNTCTVGLQNAARDQGLQVAFNQNYLQSNFAIQITPTRWLGLAANAGILPIANTDSINLSLDPAGLGYGNYQATLLLNTGDPTQPAFSWPVELDIPPIGTWRQTHFGVAADSGNAADSADPDNDGLANVVEYAFGQDPNVAGAPPWSFAFVDSHSTITFTRPRPAPSDITYIAEVTSDPGSGLWESGPAFTSQNVTDNGDGTETVVITDLSASPAPEAHYLRLRVSRP